MQQAELLLLVPPLPAFVLLCGRKFISGGAALRALLRSSTEQISASAAHPKCFKINTGNAKAAPELGCPQLSVSNSTA
jgi:hypothetical protein